MWVGKTDIKDFEALNKLFVSFDSMGENGPTVLGKIYILDDQEQLTRIHLDKKIIQWCRDSYITYRKIKTYSMTVVTTAATYQYGGTAGLLFYCEEDAMAFKLRWT